MGQHLTQPEEIDQILKSIQANDMKLDKPVTDNQHLSGTRREGWIAGYVSPYRAAYIKSHHFHSE